MTIHLTERMRSVALPDVSGFETVLTEAAIERHTRSGHWLGRTITDYLDEYARTTPGKTAFVDHHGQVTYGELRALVDRVALGFLGLGIRPGDVISFQLPNWIEWILVHFAASRIGAVSNPLIPIYREREVGFMVGLAESRLVVVPRRYRGFDYPAMVEHLRSGWPSVENVLVVGGPDDPDSWEELLEAASGGPGPEEAGAELLRTMRPDPNDITLLIFTSGTTGEPKGVMHTHNTLIAHNAALSPRVGITSDTVFHMASTLGHLTGFLFGARLNVQNGATCVLQDAWDAKRFIELVEDHGITYTSAASPFLYDLIDAPRLASHDVSSLTRFCCMGAPIPRALLHRARQALPGLVVLGGWGQTENGLVTLGIPSDPVDKITGTDGYPFPGMELRVVDERGTALPPLHEGALQVRGPFLFVGYARRLEMTRLLFCPTEDGGGDWFDTGDVALLDDEGYVRLTGRTKDVIIRGGENIPVSYVENALYEHPDLAAVAVVAMPDPRLQERACACVVMRPGVPALTFEGMQDFMSDRGLAKQYWPEKLVVLDAFPTTPSGKIQKFRLRHMVAGEMPDR